MWNPTCGGQFSRVVYFLEVLAMWFCGYMLVVKWRNTQYCILLFIGGVKFMGMRYPQNQQKIEPPQSLMI